jgi:hypothetical protein
MNNITMCGGFDCKLKNVCYRYRAVPNSIDQSYFASKPNVRKDKCFARIETFHVIREVGEIEGVTLEVHDGVSK